MNEWKQKYQEEWRKWNGNSYQTFCLEKTERKKTANEIKVKLKRNKEKTGRWNEKW